MNGCIPPLVIIRPGYRFTENRIPCAFRAIASAAPRALTAAGVPNQLITIKGGGHGQFIDMHLEGAYGRLRGFLREHRCCRTKLSSLPVFLNAARRRRA